MAYDIEEQEQLESLKAWWAKYGNFILAVATIVLLAAAAWNGWQWYQRSQAANALAQFEVLEKAAEAGDLTRVKDSAGTILEQYSGTGYAPRAALLAAHAYEKAGDVRSARAQLQWVADRSGDEALAAVARLRLAGLLLDEKSYDEALNALASPPPAAFAALYADRRGDVLAGQGKRDEARKAYEEALAKLDASTELRSSIQLKLDALGGA
ncbi:tetratricopeptide repeat protein [Pigmentiphaga sp.]|uniref:YfgM family protein n=1 Tax=Pigmentiphaga sp. TaxID=1977564 RepID=UPI00128BD679|nr:tetratricopeptide repeat protein [Pigmentiphaga sp.]MPS28555.1 tetratricopeptide repeat protein [Alcaligenaceae bacterium SAGV5]MPS52302.1 tetratricopeptide repeat protein [Alcaligenaceae bacterium SAGV3]MPT57584.1 tetratricopeptide repeat protein [Alcaligenaceae bacterium]